MEGVSIMGGSSSRVLVRLVLLALPIVLASAAFAQTPAIPPKQSTAPPPGWEEQWVGMYAGQDQPGKNAPPGFTVLNPFTTMSAAIAKHLQPWALARTNATSFELEDPGMLCKPTGLFIVGAAGELGFQLLSAPGKIVLIATLIPPAGIRRIYMDRPHSKNPTLTWNGESVGHWEGDTLVVDTIGFNDKSWISPDRGRHSEELHTVERIRFVANGTYLEDQWTVDDPQALMSPYNVRRYHKKLPSNTRMNDFACDDTPSIRAAWMKRYELAEKEAAEDRAAAWAAAQADSKNDQADSKK
jgi:hypothetical protein